MPRAFLSRLLGMGDLESLLEKVKSATDEKKQKAMEKKLKEGKLSLEDVVEQVFFLGVVQVDGDEGAALLGHVERSRLVDIDMTDPLVVLDHRDTRLFHDPADQFFPAARDHKIDPALLLQKKIQRGIIRCRHKIHVER